MLIPYDPTPEALYWPERRETVFIPSQPLTVLAIAVEAARLAYVRAEQSAAEEEKLRQSMASVGFTTLSFFSHADVGSFAFAAYRQADETALVAFRGTQPDDIQDLLTDLKIVSTPWETGGYVHSGFAKAARVLRSDITDWLANQAASRKALILCGHSLGAALATLFASLVETTQVVTLGSPRVGDSNFAKSLSLCNIIRLVNCCDLVTKLPPAGVNYEHAGLLRYITQKGIVLETTSLSFMATDEALGRVEYIDEYAMQSNTVMTRDLADHAPINYVRAFFNSP